jgi:hypothetical protein
MNRFGFVRKFCALCGAGGLALALVAGEKAAPEEDSVCREEEQRRLITGIWEDDYQGRRTMTLREDGTGVMLVELSGVKAALFAPRLRFDMVWSLENGRLKQHTTGGEPSGKVNMILRTMGDRIEYSVLEINRKSLRLLDPNGKRIYEWRRVKIPED